MLTLFDDHVLADQPVSPRMMTWGMYLAQVAPFRCVTRGWESGRKEIFERDALRRQRWARAVLHLIFPVAGASGFDSHPWEGAPVQPKELTWMVLLVQACRLEPIDLHLGMTEKEEMERFLADAWERVEWAKAMLHRFIPLPNPTQTRKEVPSDPAAPQ